MYVQLRYFQTAAVLILISASAMTVPGAEPASVPFFITRSGKAACPIIVSDTADASVRQAAQILKDKFGRMSGAGFEIVIGNGLAGIAVGLRSDFPALADCPALRLEERLAPTDLATRQGYILHSHAQGIQLVGASEIGVLYGAWDLLYRLGHRQFFPDPSWEVLPDEPNLNLAVSVFEKPDYISRHIAGSVSQDWSERNRATIYGGWQLPFKPYLPEYWQQPLIRNQHNWGAIITHSQDEFAAHPEYLGLVTVPVNPFADQELPEPGQAPAVEQPQAAEALLKPAADGGAGADDNKTEQRRVSSKLCVSNLRVRELAAVYALDYFEKNPDAPSLSLEPTDGGNWCECAGCAEVGAPSERVALLANTVAKALEERFPDKYLGILAYHLHADAPEQVLQPRIAVNLATALSGSKPMEQRLDEWSRVCGNLGVYEYLSVGEWHFGLPARPIITNITLLTDRVRDYHRRNVRFFTGQAAGAAWGGHGFGYYLLSRLLWDVGQAEFVEEIFTDFLERAFGSAAGPMRDYWNLVDASRTKPEERPGSAQFFVDRAREMYRALRDAKELTADPAVIRRLEQLALYSRYVELYGLYALTARGADNLERRKAAIRLMRFTYRIRQTGIQGIYGFFGYHPDTRLKEVVLRPALPVDPLSLDEPEPVVHYVDQPFTSVEIEAILNGSSEIPLPELQTLTPPRPGVLNRIQRQ